jgi:uracil-DNA glycosylase
LTPYKNVRVVIVGQDPYHGEGEAHGLSFSVQDGIKIPPSLQNIYKELYSDLGIKIPSTGDLTKWAQQGVLLLNSVLTVKKDAPASHKDLGWQLLTDYVIQLLNEKEEPVVFILWGAFARSKKVFITNKKHLIIESPHPSPFSARTGFFGSKPFSKTNIFLKKNNYKEIDFSL